MINIDTHFFLESPHVDFITTIKERFRDSLMRATMMLFELCPTSFGKELLYARSRSARQ